MARQTIIRLVATSLLMGCLGQPVHAQSNGTAATLLLQQAERITNPKEAWLLLQSHVDEHLKNVNYNYALGIYAAKSGQYGHAINALERVVLIQPDYSGAWLDLSLAYAGAGDYLTAIELANYVQARLDPPAHVNKLLNELLPLWRQQIQRATQKDEAYQLSFDVGYSSNPTASTEQEMVALFLGQWISLPLATQERANASGLLGVSWQGYQSWQRHRIYSYLSLRQYPNNDLANQWLGSLYWVFPEDALGSWQLGLDRFEMRFAGYQSNVSIARNMNLSPAWQLRLGYRIRTGAEPSYHAQLPSLTLTYFNSINQQHRLRFYVSAEQDYSLHQRPGGQGSRLSAGGVWDTRFDNGYGLLFSYAVSNYRDTESYSTLLPITRHLTWQQWRTQLTIPIDASWSAALVLQHEQQLANHALFSWQDTQYLGRLTYAF